MMMDQLRQRVEAALRRDIQLGTKEKRESSLTLCIFEHSYAETTFKMVKAKCCMASGHTAVPRAPRAL